MHACVRNARDVRCGIEEGREPRTIPMGEGRRRVSAGSAASPCRAQPHSARCESRACGNKQFVTSRGSKPATAYALSRILSPFLSLRLRLLFSRDPASLARLPPFSLSISLSLSLGRPVRFPSFLILRPPLAASRASFTHDVTPPPSRRSDVTINSRRITLFSTRYLPHAHDR